VRPSARALVGTAIEIVLSVAIASCGVALLEGITPAGSLGILYLLAVLALAIRRGELAALVTALLGALTFNFLFIAPRHRLAIAHSRDVVNLVVLLIAAVVVGRLASIGRQRAAEAERRARIAAAREREAKLLAEVASSILPGRSIGAQLRIIGNLVAVATGATGARVAIEHVPSPIGDELALPLHGPHAAWLYVTRNTSWSRAEIERIAEPLGRLIDVAVERERVADQAAETEAARRAEVAKTAVLHAISHDLRSPLTAIATAVGGLRARLVTAAEREELIDVIDGESVRLGKLVDDLLDLSRIESGAVMPQADWCDLGDVVASAVVQSRSDQRIDVELPDELPLVRADAAQLERVFSNLIDNALKFSPPGEMVRVSGGAAGARVIVRVSDRGLGIPRKDRSRVFEPFFRSADRGAGSGLGLAICRGFVEANGGQIILQPSAERGTSFAVSFPVARPSAGDPATGGSAVSGVQARAPR
jgi:two-component system sensor histidine kinase KdpD